MFSLCFCSVFDNSEFASTTKKTNPDSTGLDSGVKLACFFVVFFSFLANFPRVSFKISLLQPSVLLVVDCLIFCCLFVAFFLSFFKHVCFFSKTAKAAKGKANPDSTKDSIPDSNLQVSQFLHFSASFPSDSFKLTCCSQFVFSLFF